MACGASGSLPTRPWTSFPSGCSAFELTTGCFGERWTAASPGEGRGKVGVGESMRIISVSTDYPSSGNPTRGLFVKRRLEALSKTEELQVVHLQPWFPWIRPWRGGTNGHQERPPAVHCPMFYLPGILKGIDSHWVTRACLPAIRRLEAQRPFDLIDAHFGYPEGVGCVTAALKLRRPVFITLRGLERPVLQTRGRRAQLLWALQQCTGIVCVSQSLKDLVESHGIDPNKMRVIRNAVDRSLYQPGDRDKARSALGVARDAQLIVCVGMLVQGKGQHLLLRALARLRPKHPRLRLALVGGPAHEPRYLETLMRMVKE